MEHIDHILVPTFPDFDVLITDYIPDGHTDCTAAFSAAIEAAHRAGGGRVVVPAGTYLTGPIHLKSHVNLYVEKGAMIRFHQDPLKYLPLVRTYWEGVELYNYSPLIYAFEQENLAITGEGILDGNGDTSHWWPWKGQAAYGWKEGEPHQGPGRDILFQMAEDQVPVEDRTFGEGYYLRPSFIQPFRCRNVLIQGVTVLHSPMWQIHPVLCENITIDSVKIIGHGPNNDGVDPESCKNVLIKNSYFDNGDDCIAIKSGRNADGRRVNEASENIYIFGNYMKDGHGGVVIGSEISGSVRNVIAEHNIFDSPNLDRALRIKTNSKRGGIIENIYFRNSTVKKVGGEVIQIDMDYEEGDTGDFTPIVRDIEVRNIRTEEAEFGLWIKAYERSPVQNLRIIDCDFNHVKTPFLVEHIKGVEVKNFKINGQVIEHIGGNQKEVSL